MLAENRKRESARADAGDKAEEAAGGGSATEGEQPVVTRRRTGPESMRPRLLPSSAGGCVERADKQRVALRLFG